MTPAEVSKLANSIKDLQRSVDMLCKIMKYNNALLMENNDKLKAVSDGE
jgi:hypothetical protein